MRDIITLSKCHVDVAQICGISIPYINKNAPLKPAICFDVQIGVVISQHEHPIAVEKTIDENYFVKLTNDDELFVFELLNTHIPLLNEYRDFMNFYDNLLLKWKKS